MIINRNNYEAFFLDFTEGRLSSEQVSALRRFLLDNPDLASILNEFETIEVTPEKITYNEKEKLVKHSLINEKNFDEYVISYYENQLIHPGDEKEIFRYLHEHPEKRRDFNLYAKTYLPAEKIVYPNKSSLKRRGIERRVVYSWSAVAAGMLILLAVYLLYPGSGNDPVKIVRTNKKNNVTGSKNEINTFVSEKNESDAVSEKLKIVENRKTEIIISEEIKSPEIISRQADTLIAGNTPALLSADDLTGYEEVTDKIIPFVVSDDVKSDNRFNVNYIMHNTVIGAIFKQYKNISRSAGDMVVYEKHYDKKKNREYYTLKTKIFSITGTIASK